MRGSVRLLTFAQFLSLFLSLSLRQPDLGAMLDLTLLGTSPPGSGATSAAAVPILNPGELLRNSGKFTKPTKIPGKNYSKDEVVIRNADSGKGKCGFPDGVRPTEMIMIFCPGFGFVRAALRRHAQLIGFSDGHQGTTGAHDRGVERDNHFVSAR